VDKFWLARRNEYGEMVTEALKKLVPLATSYLCEIGFSSMAAMKTNSEIAHLCGTIFYALQNNALKNV
jgi:hypothetical protein